MKISSVILGVVLILSTEFSFAAGEKTLLTAVDPGIMSITSIQVRSGFPGYLLALQVIRDVDVKGEQTMTFTTDGAGTRGRGGYIFDFQLMRSQILDAKRLGQKIDVVQTESIIGRDEIVLRPREMSDAECANAILQMQDQMTALKMENAALRARSECVK